MSEKNGSEIPCDGWAVTLVGDQLLVRLVDSLPKSKSIIMPGASEKETLKKEYHAIVHQVSSNAGTRWDNMFKVGDRILLSGTPCFLTVNSQEYMVLPMSAVICILRRKDGKPVDIIPEAG
mgnify:CR=1 FL=1